MAKKKKEGFTQLVYKSEHGDIPVKINPLIPNNKIWFQDDKGVTELDIQTLKTRRLIDVYLLI